MLNMLYNITLINLGTKRALSDIFEKRKRESSNRSKLSRTSQPGGPTPFTGLSNFAAMMMNSAMTRQVTPQQPGKGTLF